MSLLISLILLFNAAKLYITIRFSKKKSKKMSEELISKKLKELNSISEKETGKPTIPVSIAIQEACDLAELGSQHSEELMGIGLDITILDTARAKSFELSALLAKVNRALKDSSPKLEIRNKAYYHLKEAVDEIRRVGKYVYWKNKDRLDGYGSPYLKRMNKNRKKKVKKQVF